MAMPKLRPNVERKRQFQAFEVYRDLGYGRTFREVARRVNVSPTTVSLWAKVYEWDKRINEYTTAVEERKEEGALIKPADGDPIVGRIVDIMDRMEAMIKSAFHKEADGTLTPMIKIKKLEDLTKFMAEYRLYLKDYRSFIAEYSPQSKEKQKTGHIEQLNVYMSDMSQEDRIKMMGGVLCGTNDEKGRDRSVEVGVPCTDNTNVFEQGDED